MFCLYVFTYKRGVARVLLVCHAPFISYYSRARNAYS